MKTPLFPKLEDIDLQEDDSENYEQYTGIVLDPEDNLFKTVSGVFKDKKDFYKKLTARGYVVRKVFEKVVFDWIEDNAKTNIDAYMLFSTAFSKWRGNNMLDEYYVKLLNDVPKLNRERLKGNPNTRDAGKQESTELKEYDNLDTLTIIGCDKDGNELPGAVLEIDGILPRTENGKKVLDNPTIIRELIRATSDKHGGNLKQAEKIKILKNGLPFRTQLISKPGAPKKKERISTHLDPDVSTIKFWNKQMFFGWLNTKLLDLNYDWGDNTTAQGSIDSKLNSFEATRDLLSELIRFEDDENIRERLLSQLNTAEDRIQQLKAQKSMIMSANSQTTDALQYYNNGKITFNKEEDKKTYEHVKKALDIIKKGNVGANRDDYELIMNLYTSNGLGLKDQNAVQHYLKAKKAELENILYNDNKSTLDIWKSVTRKKKEESIPVVNDADLFAGSFVNDGATHAYHEIPTNGMITNPGAIKTVGTFCEGWIHEELNQDLFEGTHLRPAVRAALLQIATKFEKTLNLSLKPVDIYLTGSSANFNYNESSDIDVHLVYDFEQVGINAEILVNYFIAKKQVFNANYNIKVKGLPVEVGVENLNTPIVSTAIYSLVKDGWLIEPEYAERLLPVPDMQQYYKIVQNIENAIQSRNSKEIGKLWDELYQIRTTSLQNEGELGKGNALFKKLRNLGYLERLKKAYYSSASEELSLESLKEI
jgi:predicted nucleotidyltransferase